MAAVGQGHAESAHAWFGGSIMPSLITDDYFRKNTSVEISYGMKGKQMKMVNHYVLGDVLGEGSYGKVKEGIDSINLRQVAVKIMKRRNFKRIPNGEENIHREIEIMKKLRHNNIVQLVDVIYSDDREKFYVVLEHVEGGSLQQILDHPNVEKLPISQAQCYFRQLVGAVKFVHNSGYLHRDIKPGNMMVTRSNILKLSDFGVAEAISSSFDPDAPSSLGSPAFQPPEIALGNSSRSGSGVKVDVWAMGVTLYLLVTGRPPFEGSTLYNLFEVIGAGNFHLPDWLMEHEELVSLLKGMLEPDDGKRYDLNQISEHPWLTLDLPPEPFISLPSRKQPQIREEDVIVIVESENEQGASCPCYCSDGDGGGGEGSRDGSAARPHPQSASSMNMKIDNNNNVIVVPKHPPRQVREKREKGADANKKCLLL